MCIRDSLYTVPIIIIILNLTNGNFRTLNEPHASDTESKVSALTINLLSKTNRRAATAGRHRQWTVGRQSVLLYASQIKCKLRARKHIILLNAPVAVILTELSLICRSTFVGWRRAKSMNYEHCKFRDWDYSTKYCIYLCCETCELWMLWYLRSGWNLKPTWTQLICSAKLSRKVSKTYLLIYWVFFVLFYFLG